SPLGSKARAKRYVGSSMAVYEPKAEGILYLGYRALAPRGFVAAMVEYSHTERALMPLQKRRPFGARAPLAVFRPDYVTMGAFSCVPSRASRRPRRGARQSEA